MVKKLIQSGLLLLILCGCSKDAKPELSDFTSDGCSLFMDGTFKQPDLWRECCLKHDMAYWQGGTKKERIEADLTFKLCVEKKTGDPILAKVMYEAVRAGGGPHFPTWYRWGYGWPVGRGYQKLSNEEKELANLKLKKFRNSK